MMIAAFDNRRRICTEQCEEAFKKFLSRRRHALLFNVFIKNSYKGTSKNSSHEESAESFPYARVAGSSQKTFAEDKLCARIFVVSDEKIFSPPSSLGSLRTLNI